MRFMFALATAAALAGCRQDPQDHQEQAGRPGPSPGQPSAEPKPARPRGPDPGTLYAVGVDGAPSIGPAGAPVTVVMAYEYACPWCNRQGQVFRAVRDAYGDDVRFVFRSFVVHEDAAGPAALA